MFVTCKADALPKPNSAFRGSPSPAPFCSLQALQTWTSAIQQTGGLRYELEASPTVPILLNSLEFPCSACYSNTSPKRHAPNYSLWPRQTRSFRSDLSARRRVRIPGGYSPRSFLSAYRRL